MSIWSVTETRIEGEIFRGEVKAVPVGEGGRRYPITRDDAVLLQPEPMEGGTVRRLYGAQRSTGSPPRWGW